MAQTIDTPKALTLRSGIIALVLVVLWTFACCTIAVNGQVFVQELLMIVGFGAILTLLLLQFPRLFLATVLIVYVGTWSFFYYNATAEDYSRLTPGLLWSLPVAVLALVGAEYLRRRPLTRRELAVIYAAVVVAIPWCICIKATIESSTANLFEQQRRSEGQVYAWSKEMPWWGPTIASPEVRLVQSNDGHWLAAWEDDGKPHSENLGDVAKIPLPEAQKLCGLAQTRLATSRPPAQESLDAVAGFWRGNGGEVPWELWWRPMLFWTGTCLAFEAMLMGLLLMFRRRWIEHERLPMVWSQPALHIIGPEDFHRPPRRQWILFAIGVGICLPGIILLNPSGAPTYTWTVPPWAGQEGLRGGFDLTGLNILPNVPLRLFWGPLVLTIFVLFPLDVLMTVAVTYIIMGLLLPQLMYSLGIGVGPARIDDFVKWGLRFGGGVGILFWSLWYNRKTIWGFLTGRGASGEAGPEEIPRGLVTAICIGGMAAFIILGCYATTLIQSICLTVLILVYAFTQVRQRVEGMPLTCDNNIGSHQMTSIQRDFVHDHFNLADAAKGNPPTPSSWGAHFIQWGFVGQLKTFGPHNMLLEAFKVGHELKVHARTIALVILVAMLIVAALTPVLYVKLMYTYGFANSFQGDLATWSSFTQWSERSASYGIHSTSQVFILSSDNFYDRYRNIFNPILGVAIIGVLFYLRREYPRFLVNPVGVVIAAEYFGEGGPWSPVNVWFSFLLAGVFKALIFRWMGVRSFREKIQPAAIMLLCGMIYGLMLYLFRQLSLGSGFLK